MEGIVELVNEIKLILGDPLGSAGNELKNEEEYTVYVKKRIGELSAFGIILEVKNTDGHSRALKIFAADCPVFPSP